MGLFSSLSLASFSVSEKLAHHNSTTKKGNGANKIISDLYFLYSEKVNSVFLLSNP